MFLEGAVNSLGHVPGLFQVQFNQYPSFYSLCPGKLLSWKGPSGNPFQPGTISPTGGSLCDLQQLLRPTPGGQGCLLSVPGQ